MTIRTGNAWPPARMRGLATKIQRQPFAPWQRIFSFGSTILVAGETRARLAPSNLELAI
jgi:hypothetical protein